jgi:cyclophilin family peptidyl-prolyl cis-trans isomerase
LLSVCTSALAADLATEEPRLADERIILRTVCGDIVLGLYPDVAPNHAAQLIKLARLGVYDTTHFHRIEPNFVLQISNTYERPIALSDEQQAAIHPLKAEFSTLKHVRGILSMAHGDGNPDDGETSFSILLGTAPHLDGNYTIFGRVLSGMDVVDALAAAPRVIDPKTNTPTSRPKTRLTVFRSEVATADELKTKQLMKAMLLPPDPEDVALKSARGIENLDPGVRMIVIGGALIVVVALIGFLFSSRFSPGVLLAFNLANSLIAGCLFMIYLKASASLPTPSNEVEVTFQDRLDPISSRVALMAVATVAVIGIGGSLLVRHRAPKMLLSFNLINALIGGFLVFTLVVPLAPSNQWLALGLFVGAVSVIKLMSQFET